MNGIIPIIMNRFVSCEVEMPFLSHCLFKELWHQQATQPPRRGAGVQGTHRASLPGSRGARPRPYPAAPERLRRHSVRVRGGVRALRRGPRWSRPVRIGGGGWLCGARRPSDPVPAGRWTRPGPRGARRRPFRRRESRRRTRRRTMGAGACCAGTASRPGYTACAWWASTWSWARRWRWGRAALCLHP